MARVYLKGLPQLLAKLKKLREQTSNGVAPAMVRGADSIVAMMKRQVPVKSGDLRDSIGWSWGAGPRGSISIASARVGPLTLTIHAGNEKAWYARLVEFGSAPHPQGGTGKGTFHPGNPPANFFFSSYRAMRKEVKAQLRKAIRDEVRKLVR